MESPDSDTVSPERRKHLMEAKDLKFIS